MPEDSANPVRLGEASLEQLTGAVGVPAYSRRAATPSIVHIGVGGFFRAHQAAYLDTLLADGDHDAWGYRGLGLLDHDVGMRDALAPQQCLYTLVERSARGDRARVIGSLLDYRLAADDREAAIEFLASPECRIVSLTITESGYYLDKATGGFDLAHPDVAHDLAHPHAPRCTFGFLTEALARRQTRELAPFDVMSCDNVQHNGDVARSALLAFAEARSPELARWIGEEAAFPNSMVDRITPATTDEHRQLVRDQFAIQDAWPVMTEPFSQWVLEDCFRRGRPAWERAGVQLTGDVAPYERMKIRLLNASHQAMCHIGLLLGYEFAHQAMVDPHLYRLIERMMGEEVAPLLETPGGMDLAVYRRSLLERFGNPKVRDQLARIATDGSVRIAGFVLPSIVEQIERDGPCRLLSFAVACWLRTLAGTDDDNNPIPVNDARREQLMAVAARAGRDPIPLLGIDSIFGRELPASTRFVEEVTRALDLLYARGAAAALEAYVTH